MMASIPLELAILIGLFAIIFITTIVCSIFWVTFPPEDTIEAGVGWHLLLIITFPVKIAYYYLVHQEVHQHQCRKTRIAGILVIAGVVSLIGGSVLSSPDVISITADVVLIYPVGIAIGYLLTKPTVNIGRVR